jgi:Kef-type K+ transport system membrane component KefB
VTPELNPAVVNVRTLLAVGVVMIAVWLVGRVVGRIGQPRVIGEIVAGIVLGPSLLGLLLPDVAGYLFPGPVVNALGVLAQVGLVMFMFLIGLELDVRSLRGQGSRLAIVSSASIVVPLVLAAGLAVALYPMYGGGVDETAFCLFFAAAMAITAFPVLARLLQESGLMSTRLGALSLTSAAVNDVVAWCLVAVVIAVGRATGPADALRTLGLAVGYVVVMLVVVRPLLARLREVPIWLVLVITLLSSWAADQAGIHVIFGGFMAGVVMPRLPQWQRSVQGRLEVVVSYLLLPVFFVVTGLSIHIDRLAPIDLLVVAAVIAVATLGKLGGSTVAARLTGERWSDALTLGVLMNTRGLTEIVVLSVGLQLHIITPALFTIMVLMALVTTVMAPPLLRMMRRRVGAAEPLVLAAATSSGSSAAADANLPADRGEGGR